MQSLLKYIQGYPESIIKQVEQLIAKDQLVTWFEQRYPQRHDIQSEKALFAYTMSIKNHYMKKTPPISKVMYDGKIHLINNALGLHSYVSRVHGSKIKTKNEIRIATAFKEAPEPLLRMLVVHELAHLREKDHNKAFYQLCCHMEPNYHQLELDARLYMMVLELK
ncbi:M48 family peptidase [Vibrio cincinnatiensis]|uniref:M48 metallopeptidase family protein n=1 Tax=Vibrio cincinnatiensis TaxID=675 RepID=UPI001EE08AC7|nr:M48 family metallopeptidase [Vibrio cincinnatiensis]MCG3733487.1 M48 family peptidase [Vibrio cincinnatiensis]MCG3740817.1 M48 family peptidase [Vibrio cincinnatiensis]MCG3744353.1 M48 family peptidase [Vibrio cincinnatiensis]MCG3747942.1 M48 family peptidase [Vibrio cincinnatiensis]MCG3767243.1 M48 family peptidase [Vibrio cincinnatiensis]